MFSFGDGSKYAALLVNDAQFKAIEKFEAEYGIPVHYLLYHPGRIPSEATIPSVTTIEGDEVEVGARVVPATMLRGALAAKPENYSPRYLDVKDLQPTPWNADGRPPGWLVEHFVADLAVDCHVGHIVKKENDEGLSRIFYRRSGPISAAIAVTFDAPPGADVE